MSPGVAQTLLSWSLQRVGTGEVLQDGVWGAVTTVRLETTEITQQQKRFHSIQIALKWGA